MKAISSVLLSVVLTIAGVSQTNSLEKKGTSVPDRERLIGAWRLRSMSGPDGKPITTGSPIGMLIYTRDGHMSVQLMYPDSTVTNDYVLNGYEASFGSFDVNPSAHTVTHHVRGSVTRGLVGKDLTRRYRLEGSRLIIRSTRADESWQVTWEHE